MEDHQLGDARRARAQDCEISGLGLAHEDALRAAALSFLRPLGGGDMVSG